ncbi:MAG: tetratricopeptide repeat protein [Burkholderiaceae bacterium]
MTDANKRLIQAIEWQNAGRLDDAAALFEEILQDEPGNAPALYSICVILLNRGKNEEALRWSLPGVERVSQFAPLQFVHGAILQNLGRKEEALAAFDRALLLKPDYIEVMINSGALLREMLRHKEALERFNRVLQVNPQYAPALANCGIILTEFKQSEQAIGMFQALLKIQPDYDYGLGLLLYEQLHICDWSGLETLKPRIIDGVRAGQKACKTLALMAITDNAEDHFIAARTFSRSFCARQSVRLWNGERYRHRKIRLAYLSPDLREHPVGHLMAGVIERHDKSRFELTAISLGIDDGSRLRARMVQAFDHFIDAKNMGSLQIAQLLREREIDIAVDLAGYTTDSRTAVFSYRPVPVQVNYLGYPGTLGAEYMDYILADRHIIPEHQQRFYDEKVVYLPDTYLPTDSGLVIAEGTPSRAECGLPDTGVVFCSFSHDYKITPPMFDVWMRLLKRCPDSVLWLMSRGELAQRNLRRNAEVRGVDPARLIFAGRVPRVEDHLARYRQADLFLDTFPYNAHTTAADAMMAGLPVVTYMGNGFASRVAGSLVHAIGLPELATSSLEAYEELAYQLVTVPGRLAELKARLRANQKTHALFDTESFSRNLEAAYIGMWRQAELGGAHDELCGPLHKQFISTTSTASEQA